MTWRSGAAAVGLVAAGTGVLAAVGSAGSTDAPTREAIDGAGLFIAKGCAMCHDGPDSTSMFGIGPSLADVSTWAGDRRPAMDAEAYLGESITNPSAFISPASTSGASMPPMAVTDDEVELLIEHLLNG